MIHVIVENQLALDDQIVRATLARLTQDELTRHDALHAIGSVLIEYMNELLKAKQASPDGHAAYYAALQKLTAASWRSRY